ncbi:carbon-nitrogen hydrolase family protein [Microbulbifer pacificus]|uniref:Nitrilase-related carbon-nitrogen hydrolase n=1 Tax=Microbulbifer pacificus TaxID=407164 RepID=A0AAU0N141_9GAMM|nr:nitrilase-related carbon-nitrogen hydrolase [Microbulbifer pacificus]WOX06181.1 nitrilase-related carbon-nitrogen hydrolase [Microbulbifer pacificus]
MIKKLFVTLVLCIAVLVALLYVPPSSRVREEPPVVLEPLNTPRPDAENLVSIQPYLTPDDYASAERLQRKLHEYLQRARDAGLLSAKSLVVFPEHIGTWLVAEGESFMVFSSRRTDTALFWSALGNLPQFARLLMEETATDPFAAALFKSKSAEMAGQYQQIFSGLAREFGVTLVAGSIVLPDPKIEDNRISLRPGPLYNNSFVFYADGGVAGPVRKNYPIDSEQPFIQPGDRDLPIFQTPLGRLAVLICADSWYPYSWQQIASADIVAVPSFSSPSGIWQKPWAGYNGAATPIDVDRQDIGRLSEGEAWLKYALAGRGGHIRAGINTFLRGDLWDLGDDGRTTAIINGEVMQGERRNGAIISSVWLP